MKKLLCWLLLVSLFALCACSGEEAAQTEGTTEEAYPAYQYEDMPENYTELEALEDKCLVLSWPEGELKPIVTGTEHWKYFLKALENDVDEARIRAVYFQNGNHYYTDLTYFKGEFNMYTLNEFQSYEKAVGPYAYIKHIEGVEPNTGNLVSYYVLSELENLTSEDVLSAARICDIETERGVPYEPIPFTQYGIE